MRVNKWLQNPSIRSQFESQLTPEIKSAIFWIAFQVDDWMTGIYLMQIFNLKLESRRFMSEIKRLLKPPCTYIKRCLSLIIGLEIVDQFTIEQTVIPAVLLGLPTNCYEEYLDADKSQAAQFVLWLDGVMKGGSSRLRDIYDEYKWVSTNLDFSRLNSKSIAKFIKKSVERYELSYEEVAPNYVYSKKIQDLHYQVRFARDKMRKFFIILVLLDFLPNSDTH